MKKNLFLFGLFVAICLFNLLESIAQPSQTEFANYITISNGEFHDGNNVFKPFCINYIEDFACYLNDLTDSIFYIAPHFNYSNTGTEHKQTIINDSLYDWHWCYGTNGQTEMDTAKAKLEHDLKVMDSLGFNVVRLRSGIYWKNDILHIPTGSYARYFELMDTLIAKCAQHGLRVILVMSDDTNVYKQFDNFCVCLDSITRHFSNNKTVMAYVVFAEPGYKWKTNPDNNKNDKLMISNWSRKWYYLIKKNAPNQLVTYGLDGINNVLFWDPSALTYDFLSMHFYYHSSNSMISSDAVNSYLKWMNDNVDDVWVLGENGFSGTNSDLCIYNFNSKTGTEKAQHNYVNLTMQKALECGCKGYAWWQYQEVKWNSCLEDYFGLITHYPNERLKMAHSLFPTFKFRMVEDTCGRPDCYYNIPGYSRANISGVVRDQNSNPIKDAFVVAWSDTYATSYSTFTNNQGEYTIYTPVDTVLNEVRISQKGYTQVRLFAQNSTFNTTTLTHINYDGWKKNWANINYPIAGDNPIIASADTIVVGNFCGDEAQELLAVRFSTSMATLYCFQIDHWEQIWIGTIGGWVIRSIDKFSAGDFDGDGQDELLCFQNVSGAWVSVFHFDSLYPTDPWQYFWTNMGSGYIGNWYIVSGDVIEPGYFYDSTYSSLMCIRNKSFTKALHQRFLTNVWSWSQIWSNNSYIGSWALSSVDNYYVGDFSGDGIDELLCAQVTVGDSDWMKLLQYNSLWDTLWTNNGQSGYAGINPYRGLLHVGNFDQDGADELLGVGTWATKFDFNTLNQWEWSWSTYESGRLSDWTVTPNHLIFFMKAMTDVPDYLFVGRWPPRSFRLNAYSFDPQ